MTSNDDVVDSIETASDDGTETERSDGLDPNLAGALSYLFGPVTGILFYVLEDDDEFVRFHAVQSILVFGGLFVVSVGLSVVATVLSVVPVVGLIVSLALGLVSLLLVPVAFVAWVGLMYTAYRGDRRQVPLVGAYARRYASVS